jgi:hypothetical protein
VHGEAVNPRPVGHRPVNHGPVNHCPVDHCRVDFRVEAGAHAPGHQAVLPARIKIGEQDGDGLADQPAPVDHEPVPAQRETRLLYVEKFGGRYIDGDLLIVLFPAGRLSFI